MFFCFNIKKCDMSKAYCSQAQLSVSFCLNEFKRWKELLKLVERKNKEKENCDSYSSLQKYSYLCNISTLSHYS